MSGIFPTFLIPLLKASLPLSQRYMGLAQPLRPLQLPSQTGYGIEAD
jgi:hypothetical protein